VGRTSRRVSQVLSSSFSRLQTFRLWRLIRHYRRTLTCAMLRSKLTANMSHKHWNDWGSPISATSR
jgi:hypothetical protein